MDTLEIIVREHDHDRFNRQAPVSDVKIYHEIIRDQEFVQHAHNVINSLRRDVSSGSLNSSHWYTYWFRFATDGMTTLIYSGRTITPAWTINDTVNVDGTEGPGTLKTYVLFDTLHTRYHMPSSRSTGSNILPEHLEIARAYWEAYDYTATCQIQTALGYPGRAQSIGTDGQIVIPADDYYRLIYFAELVRPDGSKYTLYVAGLEAERAATQLRLTRMILAEGWEPMGTDSLFGLPRRRRTVAPDQEYAVCQIVPIYKRDPSHDILPEEVDYAYFRLGFSAGLTRPNLSSAFIATRMAAMPDDAYCLGNYVRPDSIQHPWNLYPEAQIAAWDDLVKELLEDGWEQATGVGKFRMSVAESYKYADVRRWDSPKTKW
jgi:hypothetical protein